MISANQGGSFFAPLQNYSRGAAAHRGAVGAFPRGGFANQQGEHAPGGVDPQVVMDDDNVLPPHQEPFHSRGRGARFAPSGFCRGTCNKFLINYASLSYFQKDRFVKDETPQDVMNGGPSYGGRGRGYSRGGNGRGAFTGFQNQNNVFGNVSG
uniref:Uncharacterized protein n=1 Tax=Panagrolaimus superbus TaxID=310955 RepID=A0A914Y7Q3_9BILA